MSAVGTWQRGLDAKTESRLSSEPSDVKHEPKRVDLGVKTDIRIPAIYKHWRYG